MNLSALLMVGAVLAACSPSPKHQSIEFLASDAHVVVGGVPLIVPFVALTGLITKKPSFSFNKQKDHQAAKERLEAFRNAASSQETAPSADQLEITMSTFGSTGVDSSREGICALLSRQWAKSVCDDPRAPLQQALPIQNNRFFLVDDRNLDVFQNHLTVGGERVWDQLQQMRLKVGEASVVCDAKSSSKTRFCTAAISIKQHLAAVWTVWDSSVETHARQAEREGKGITAFVIDALGPIENFPALLSAACKLRNPTTPTGPRESPCTGSN
ncbi:hypothetical protein [Phyllobacterium sophorae]|uniref:hypothetical protein n=1 Tax=Phyllobacterium sophorae TaxID=1520277 RepID=UPI001FE10695|nr:hypothetical protein [Phyllobacterium sophorae]